MSLSTTAMFVSHMLVRGLSIAGIVTDALIRLIIIANG